MMTFQIGEDTAQPVTAGGGEIFIISGPCVIESEEHALGLAREIASIAARAEMPIVFKASFDKANRTSIDAFRGPGLERGLEILELIRNELGLPVLTDIHEASQVDAVASVVDILQIPAFLCRQTDLILAAAETGKPVMIKKGQFLAPGDMRHVVAKAEQGGATKILLAERGASFGYNNLVSDMRSIVEMRNLGWPVVYDATHSIQTPGGAGASSGGTPEFIPPLIRAAVAVGVDGVFMEVHDDPPAAKSDGANALHLARLEAMIETISVIDEARKACPEA